MSHSRREPGADGRVHAAKPLTRRPLAPMPAEISNVPPASPGPIGTQPVAGTESIRTWQRLAGNRAVSRLLDGAIRVRQGGDRSPEISGNAAVVQRDDKNTRVPVAIYFTTPQTRAQFVATTNAQLGLPNATWLNVKDHYDATESPVQVLVRPSTLRAARSKTIADEIGLTVEGNGAISGTSAREQAFAKMPAGGEKQALFDEIDRRYYHVTATPAGLKIKEEETGKRELWLQIQNEVLAQREFATNLPDKVQLIIKTRAGGVVITPAQYQQLIRVAGKIQLLSESDIENYLSQGGGPAQSLDALEAAVAQFAAAKAAAPGQISEVMKASGDDSWKLDTVAAAMPAQVMFYLSLADRVKLIKQVADGFLVGDEDEQTIIRLLTTTPAADLKALTAELKANESALLKKLESVIDGSENKQYYSVLRSIVFGSMSPEESLEKMQAAKIFPWADPGAIKAAYNRRFYYEKVEYTEDGKVRVLYWINIGPIGMRAIEQILEPDEMIGLHFFMDEDFANAKEGETIYMPAANLITFKNEQFSRELYLAVDVGLLFAGGAGLLTKASRLAMAIAILDTTMAAASLVINSFRSDIAKSEEGKQFLKVWDITQTLIAAYGIGKLVLRLPDTFRGLRKAYDTFKSKTTGLSKSTMTSIEDEAGKLFKEVDNAVFESEIAGLRKKFSADELAAFETQLAKAGEITDAAKRQAAVNVIEEQVTTQKSNVELIAELKAANPTLKEGEIAKLAASRIKVPSVPHGMTLEEFTEAQTLIGDWLAKKGITDATGFATGSRVTGATFNPGKKASFGKAITDFTDRDFDITLITNKKLTSDMQDELMSLYKSRFKHDLGIRNITDTRQLDFIPIWGKIDLNLK